MQTRRGIGIGLLLAALGAGTAVAHSNASFRGTVVDGRQDYSDEAFAPLVDFAAKMAKGDVSEPEMGSCYVPALVRIICPHGPMAGLRVVLRSDGDKSAARETTTDAQGKFGFTSLEIGEYDLTAYKPGKEGEAPEAFTWRLKVEDEYRQKYAELALPPTFIQAKGRVTDSAGQPLAGMKIQAMEYRYNGELGSWSSVRHEVEAMTDEQGRFELPRLHPMPFRLGDGGPAGYVLKVEGAGYVLAARKIDVVMPETLSAMEKWAKIVFGASPARDQKDWRKIKWPVSADAHGILDGVDFTLLRAATLGGRVMDAAGAPLAAARVSVRHLDAPPYQPLPFWLGPGSVNTDDAGRFSVAGLATGRYVVAVAVDGRSREYRDAPVELREGEVRTNLDLRYEVPPTGRIEASVLETGSGRPIGVYTAYVERVFGTPDSGETHGRLAKDTNQPGHFTVEDISPGEAQFHLSAPGYVSRRAACVVASGKTTDWTIEMQSAGAASVRVTCNGIATRPSQLVSFPGGATNPVWGSWRTNAAGRCEIHELPPGLNRLRAQVFGNDQSRYALVAVQIEAGRTNSAELEMEGPCSFDLDLAFPTNATLRAWVEPADAPETESFDAKVDLKVFLWAYESGRVAVTNLPAGEYRIGVQKLESTKGVDRVPMKADQTQTIRLDEDRRPTVAFGF